VNSIYVGLHIKKSPGANEGSGESGDISPPQDGVGTTGTEKVVSKSPEVHETKLVIHHGMTF
jgi:hypothetical protein